MLKKLGHYFSNIVLIWLAILLYRTNKYYANYLTDQVQTTLLIFAIAYTVIGLFYYIIIPIEKVNKSKGTVLFSSLKKMLVSFKNYLRNFGTDARHPFPKLPFEEKTNLLFLLVKLFFLPLMLQFFYGNFNGLQEQIPRFNDLEVIFSVHGFNFLIFPTIISLFFLIDTAYFAFGYTFESKYLNNKVRSVEPTTFGWIVALLTYPPFNDITSNYIGWYANDMIKFSGDITTMIARFLIIICLFVYVSASIALGAKCSNLTNRGIVSRGPYAYIRHPAYVSKNLAWWIMTIPLLFSNPFSLKQFFIVFFSTLVWSTLYFFRAVTEERHLIKDPDYQKYVKKVKYMFIPKVL